MTMFLGGEGVVLRPLAPEAAPVPECATNYAGVASVMCSGQRPRTVGQLSDENRRQVDNPGHAALLVEDRLTGKPVGFAALYDSHATARKAEFRILLGAKEF